jgi:hypothetical protein
MENEQERTSGEAFLTYLGLRHLGISLLELRATTNNSEGLKTRFEPNSPDLFVSNYVTYKCRIPQFDEISSLN